MWTAQRDPNFAGPFLNPELTSNFEVLVRVHNYFNGVDEGIGFLRQAFNLKFAGSIPVYATNHFDGKRG